MSDFFGKIITKISAIAGFPIMVYVADSKTMVRYTDSTVETIPVPPSIVKEVDNESAFFFSKTIGDKSVIIYFLRCVFAGKNYVFVINDSPARVKLGHFFWAFLSVFKEICANRDAIAERVKILKSSIDGKTNVNEETIAELQNLKLQIEELSKIKDGALNSLKAQLDENSRLKLASANVAEAVKRLEADVRSRDEAIQTLQTENMKIAECEERLAQTVKVRNDAIERIKQLMAENSGLTAEAKQSKENIHRLQDEFSSRISEFETKISQTVKVRNEAVLRIRSLTEENETLKSSLVETESAFRTNVDAYETKVQQLVNVRNDAVQRIKDLMVENGQIKASQGALEEGLRHYEHIIHEKDAEIEELVKTNATIAQFEEKIAQLLKVRNEAVIRIRAMDEENKRLYDTVAGFEEEIRRLEIEIMEKTQSLAEANSTIDEMMGTMMPTVEHEAKMAQIIKIRNDAISKLKEQVEENQRIHEFASGAEEIVQNLEKTIHKKDGELLEKEEIIKSKDAKIAKTRFYLDEMTELVKVVKRSRDKIMTLTDFITVPMYSVSGDRTLVHANNALAEYVHFTNVAKIVGKNCYKLVFGFDEPCPWCQLEKVQSTGTGTTMGVIINDGGKRRNMELTIFPILDSTGSLIDCGEFLVDKTDTFELAQSLKKFKEQVTTFKRAKITGMNEIQDVKHAYDELSANYDMVVARNSKLTQALESLLVQDNNKEVLNAKNETSEYKAALHRANGVINNYKKSLDELQAKYTTLNRQAIFQVERLINIVKSKQTVDLGELGSMLEHLGINFGNTDKNS